MVERDSKHIPEWARRERTTDLRWINDNLSVFWRVAQQGFETVGRGALVADTTLVVDSEVGRHNLFAYLSMADVEQHQWEDAIRMVQTYDPSWEFVAVVLKRNRESAYRLGIPSEKRRTTVT